MDIRILRHFLAVAREGNITRAAESLHIAQPSLSKQIMDLEDELGKQLLIRGKRKITLTEDGVLLRKRAEEIVALLEKTEQEISASPVELGGEISIGGMPIQKVLETAAALRADYPDIRFHFYSSDATDVTELLDHGSLDFAVLLEPVDTGKYEYLSLADVSRWGLLMPAGCALAQQSSVTRDDLLPLPLITHRRLGLQQEIAHWAQISSMDSMNIAATYNIVNGDPAVFVQSGLGYLLTTEDHLPHPLDPTLAFRPLSPALEVHHALVWKRYAMHSRAAEAFLKVLKESI